MSNLLQDIDAFLEAHDLSEGQFGVLALRDKHLVPDLRGVQRSAGPDAPPKNLNGPRRLWPETEAKVRRFMSTYRPETQGEAA